MEAAGHYHRMVKIALDATPLTIPSGGERRYTEELTRALARAFADDEFWLLSDQKFDLPDGVPANVHSGGGPRSVLERRWWMWGLQSEIARLGIDVFHGTDFAVPYLPVRPSVMTLHDLSPWMDKSWHVDADRVKKRAPILLRLGLATLVITPSEAVRKQAIERFRITPDRVVAIPHAAAKHFRPMARAGNHRPYLLYVGTIEPRKNVKLIIDTWREIRKTHPIDLILAGRRREDSPEIPAEPGLQLVGLVPEGELASFYSGALACLYPSYYEGFGLPVLEAMQCGAPVIASNAPAISEVAGDAAILLNPTDQRAWVNAVQALIENPERRRDLSEKALARAAQFSWTKTAERTHEVYRQAIERFRKKKA
jgi:alpha-1,3-rhamnosyl/mannosyltransferase